MDLDADGRNDIISGSWPGELYVFKGLDDGFAKGETIRHSSGDVIEVGNATAVFAVDWEKDGDLDLLIGEIQGPVYFVRNDGSATEPAFAPATRLAAEDGPIDVKNDSGPFVADWDGDGLDDLLLGTGFGGVVWYRNIGTPTEPRLAKAQTLLEQPESSWGRGKPDPKRPWGMRLKVCAVDYNGDGLLDLLVGDFGMRPTPAKELTEEEQAERTRLLEELKGFSKAYQAVSESPAETPEARAERDANLQALVDAYQAKSNRIRELRTGSSPMDFEYLGNVWYFQRKPKEVSSLGE